MSKETINSDITIKLKEEQLDISKERIKTGAVKMYTKLEKEEKTVKVPITREVLVVEKKSLEKDSDGETEVIRIPINEERFEVVKHKVELNDITVYKDYIEETKHIEETLKREDLNIMTNGDAKAIVDES